MAYWRTNFAAARSAVRRKDAVLIVDGTLVPTRDHTIAERSKTSHVV